MFRSQRCSKSLSKVYEECKLARDISLETINDEGAIGMNICSSKNRNQQNRAKSIWRFVVPSLTGVILFLIPLSINGEVNLLLNCAVFWIRDMFEPYIVMVMIFICGLSAFGAAVGLIKPDLFKGYLKTLFLCSPCMVLVRFAAAILIIVIYLKVGPEMLWSMDTGGGVLYGFVTTVAILFLFAGPLLPLLTEYGFMEFVGGLLRPIFRPVFKVPGRAGVHFALALVASSTISAVLSAEQYEKGYYTAREAVIMGTGFSVISVPQVALFTEVIGMPDMFVQVYILFIISILLINVIMARIPPISLKADKYLCEKREDIGVKLGVSENGYFKQAVNLAVAKANAESGAAPFVSGIKTVGDIWFTLIPQVLILGTGAMILVDYTPVTQWLSYPFIFILNVLQIPEAVEAAPTMIIGFCDIFLPVIAGARIHSEITRFVILMVAMLQVVFITTLGPVLVKSKIPISYSDLLVIFLLRTLIALPVATGLAYMLL